MLAQIRCSIFLSGGNIGKVYLMATITEKILSTHLVEGGVDGRLPAAGSEIAIKIDQTLTQDATGTMAYLEWEALGLPRVRTELSVSYVDHNTLQTDFMNADDHDYLRSVAAKYGILFSRPGNGICHQVHLERFARPGKTLLGSDSHTPTAGGAGSLAIGAGGLDVALAMGGGRFYLNMPKVVGVKLVGKLKPWVSAKDVILELLKRLDVKGGVGKVFEYFGPGVKTLSVPERATITNMGAELGATTSIFPSDNVTRKYLESEARGDQWVELAPDSFSDYKERIEIDLSTIEPMVAKPHSPGNVGKVSELEGQKVNQVIIGSCTNSSYRDLMIAAAIMKGKTVHPSVSFAILPGSRQVYEMIAKNGALADLIASGARILESACGPCIGMGLAPRSGAVTVRTFNRNFEGRCGTADAKAYLVSPETAAAIALSGVFTDPRKLGEFPKIRSAKTEVDDSMIIQPPDPDSPEPVEVIRGPNIKPLPELKPLEASLSKEVLLKVGDNVTTDHIMPAGAKILPLRSNVPAISEFVFSKVDPTFPKRAREKGGGIVVGGENYGQGSSREHAAIAPLYLGVRAVVAKSWARIHKDNLMNWGIVPLTFANPADYEKINQGDMVEMPHLRDELKAGKEVTLKVKGADIKAKCELTPRAIEILLEGGLIPHTKKHAK
jgi:aconitate hydratase